MGSEWSRGLKRVFLKNDKSCRLIVAAAKRRSPKPKSFVQIEVGLPNMDHLYMGYYTALSRRRIESESRMVRQNYVELQHTIQTAIGCAMSTLEAGNIPSQLIGRAACC